MFRYADVGELEPTLRAVPAMPREQVRARGSAGRDSLDLAPWDTIAAMTLELFHDVVADPAGPR